MSPGVAPIPVNEKRGASPYGVVQENGEYLAFDCDPFSGAKCAAIRGGSLSRLLCRTSFGLVDFL